MSLSMKVTFRSLCIAGWLAAGLAAGPGITAAQTPSGATVAQLIAQLSAEDREKRYLASVELRKMGPNAQSASEALTRALRDDDPRVSENACWTLAFIGPAGQGAVPTLAVMVRDTDEPNRIPAAAVLGLMRTSNPDAVKSLTEALTSGNPELRRTAAAALGALGQAALPAVPALARATKDDNPGVRSTAVAALGRLGGFASSAVPALREIEAGPDAQLKAEAVSARKRIESELARPVQPVQTGQAGQSTPPTSPRTDQATAIQVPRVDPALPATDQPTRIAPPRGESAKTTPTPEPISAPVVRPVQILEQGRPRYTQLARDRKTEGTVVLSVEFLANGKIGDVKVISGLSYGLNEEAIRAAKSIRFNPAQSNGKPVDRRQEIRYRFSLGQ